jgi:hypothetical protein
VGTSPLDKDVLNMVVRRGANSCAYCLRIREEISSGPKKDSSGVAPLRQEGMLIDDTRQKAEILNKQYHSVFTPEWQIHVHIV